LHTRTTIEQAKGILMGTRGCPAEEALQILVRAAQRENRKLREISEEMVVESGRRTPAVKTAPYAVRSKTASAMTTRECGSGLTPSAGHAQGVDGIITRLIRGSTRSLPDDLATLVADATRRGGFHEASILLVDLEQRVLTPLPPVRGQLGVQEIDSSIAGRAFQLERPVVVPNGESFTMWIPLVDGSERLGVLYLCSPTMSDEILARCQDLTGLVAELVVSKNQYGDVLTVARRTQDMLLAAELRWAMLPPLTFTGEHVGIACVLEPA
jgi:hypothetical protein